MKKRMKVIMPERPAFSREGRARWWRMFFLLMIVIACVGRLGHLIRKHNDRTSDHPKSSKESAANGSSSSNIRASVSRTRTNDEMKEFWENELRDFVMSKWLKYQLPYPEINSRTRTLCNEIKRRSGKSLGIGLIRKYHWAANDVAGASGINPTNGDYVVEIIIPNAMDMFESLRRTQTNQWRQKFESHIIITLMHELEHTTTATQKKYQSIDIDEESRAWAETCRHTIVPLQEKYGLPMNNIYRDYYLAWTQSHGDTNDAHWLTQMERAYGDLKGKTNPD